MNKTSIISYFCPIQLKIKMKSFSYFVCLAAIAICYVASNECMYCKSQDQRAGFLYTYSYCEDSGACVSDQWDKINAWAGLCLVTQDIAGRRARHFLSRVLFN